MSGPQEILLLERDLEQKIEQRDRLNSEITGLYMEIEIRKAENASGKESTNTF